MDIGPLDKKARVEYPVVTGQDPVYGTDIIGWALLPNGVRNCGYLDELPSRSEALKLNIMTAAQRTRVRMNYCSDIDSSMRVTIMRPNAVVYQIISGPAEIGNKDGIEMMCEHVS